MYAKDVHNLSSKPYFSGSVPSSNSWANSAKLKYTAFDGVISEYSNMTAPAKTFMDYAMAVAFDWEYFAAQTPKLLQSFYRDVIPYRTGGITRLATREAGQRFAAITSAAIDAKIMQHACGFCLERQMA